MAPELLREEADRDRPQEPGQVSSQVARFAFRQALRSEEARDHLRKLAQEYCSSAGGSAGQDSSRSFCDLHDAMAPLDARHYTGHAAPSHLFFQFAYHDPGVSIEDGERYFELASEPKQIAWYDNCGHAFNAQARLDHVTWLCTQWFTRTFLGDIEFPGAGVISCSTEELRKVLLTPQYAQWIHESRLDGRGSGLPSRAR
jgi:hypothetical protein